MYKQQWMQEKLVMQAERKKKLRSMKREMSTVKPEEQVVETKVPAKKTKKTAAQLAREEPPDLEFVIEQLKNDIQLKDEEFKDMQAEVEMLRKQNAYLRNQHKEEKIKRQTLEATKLKFTMQKELSESLGVAQEMTFFDLQKSKQKQVKTNLMGQIQEQQKLNFREALAAKYGQIWLTKVRESRDRERRQRELF